MASRVTIGDVEVLLFIDMVPPAYAPLEFFPDVAEEAWGPHRDDCLEDGTLQLYYGCFALRSQGRVLMVDTGMGPGPHATRGNRTGDLLNLLAGEGIAPDDVDVVVHTHLHLDHVGWNVTWEEGTPRPTFPRARYLAPRADWDYFTQPDVMERFPCIQESVTPLQSMGALELIDGEHSVTPEVTTLPAPGHTPGHVAVLVTSRGEKGVMVGDALHSRVQVQEPGWCARADIDKDRGLESRRALLDKAESEGLLVAAGHFRPGDQFGRVVRLQGRRYWQTV